MLPHTISFMRQMESWYSVSLYCRVYNSRPRTVEHYMCHYDNSSGVTAGDACRMLNESNCIFFILDLKRWNDVLYLCIHEHSDSELLYLFTIWFWTENVQGYLREHCWCWMPEKTLNDITYQAVFWQLNKKAYLGFEIHFNIRHKWGAEQFRGGHQMCTNRKRPKQKINNNNNNKAD